MMDRTEEAAAPLAPRFPEKLLRDLVEEAPDAMVIVEGRGNIAFLNRQTEKMFGYPREELLGRPVELLIPSRLRARHAAHRAGFLEAPRLREMGAHLELCGLRRDGTEFPAQISLSPLAADEGMFVTAAIRDISDRKRSEQALRASLFEKEVLLKELHHRVKNNLQIVSSLLGLQSAQATEPACRQMLLETRQRVRSMALVHEKLYHSRDLSSIDLSLYLRELAGELVGAFGAGRDIQVEVRAAPVSLNIDTAVYCGLLLNELLTNCIKHAFPGDRPGRIWVELSAPGGGYRLRVKDDGVGFPSDFELREASTLGLQLLATMAEQLDASIEKFNHGGTEFVIDFHELTPKGSRS